MNFPGAAGAPRRLALLGNHTPRQCGIATFTADLHAALRHRCPGLDCFVLAMNDPMKRYAYPACVQVEIDQDDPASYRRAAEILNGRSLDLLSVQHEYGIFGGQGGAHVLGLMRAARMPIVTTLHTILAEPTAHQWTTMDEVISLSERLVVMSTHGAELLRRTHGVSARKIDLIPHGIPAVPSHGLSKAKLGLDGRQVILTFGLLAPDKGIEYVIDAMPEVLRRFPGTVYVVLGATHPHFKAQQGESYRVMLEGRALGLGVEANVLFHNRFVSQEELTEFLAAADIYITPYLKMEQITSGTLAYALGSGNAVISTPYLYAQELLADGRGILVPCRDPAAIAGHVLDLLGDDTRRLALRHRGAEYGRTMAWPVVAASYLKSFSRASREYASRWAPRPPTWQAAQLPLDLPELSPAARDGAGASPALTVPPQG